MTENLNNIDNHNNIKKILSEMTEILDNIDNHNNIKKILSDIKYDSFPKIEEQNEAKLNNIPYTKGCFKTSPLLHYLEENLYYDSHASGNYDDFGFLIKTIFGIPAQSFVCIKPINSTDFKITWIVEQVDNQMLDLMNYTDYDWRVFDKLGFTTKSKIVKIIFDISDEILEASDKML